MKSCGKAILAGVFFVLVLSSFGYSQKRARLGKVCGDPNAPCSFRKKFQPNDLPFDTGRSFVIANSEYFYAVVLESEKLKVDGRCDEAFPEKRRLEVQALFPDNKVFAVRCPEPGNNYYTNVSQDASFLAVFAGTTLAEAKAFKKKIDATGKFRNVSLRRMQAGINGT